MFANRSWGTARIALIGAVAGLVGPQAFAGVNVAWAESPAATQPAATTQPSPAPATQPAMAPVPTAKSDEVRCVGEVCSLGVCVSRDLLEYPERAFRAMRVVPNFVDGKTHGFRLFGLRPGSWAAQLGFLNGDLVLSVNGQELSGPETAIAIYTSAKNAAELTLAGTRAGQPLTRRLHLDHRVPKEGECPPSPLASTASAPPSPTPPKEPPPTQQTELRRIAQDISCKATRCVLSNGVFDRVLGNVTLLTSSGRILPVLKDGQVHGFKMLALRPGSLWALLGLKNGDLLHTINGQSLGSPEQALAAYATLRDAPEVKLTLDRAGAPLTLTYVIQR